jgi:prepilin peptidase CpaA
VRKRSAPPVGAEIRIVVTQAHHLAILGIFLAIACASDVAQRRVPNAVVAPLAVAGLAAQWVSGGEWALLWGAVSGLGVLALLLVPWSLGKVGGGDVKLAAAAATWLEPARLPGFLVVAGLASAAVGIAVHLSYRLRLERMLRASTGTAAALHTPVVRQGTVPVAIAVAAATFVALLGGKP